MPRIQEYTSRTQAAGPVDLRPAQGQNLGTGAAIQNAGEVAYHIGKVVYKKAEQQEVSDLSVKFSEENLRMTQEIQQRIQKGDLDIENLDRDMEDSFGRMSEGVKTEAGLSYFKQQSTQMRGQFLERSIQYQSQLSGEKAKTDFLQELGNNTSALVSDPTGLDAANSQLKASLQARVATGSLKYEDAMKLQVSGERDLAVSAVNGWVQLNPTYALEQLNSGRYDKSIDGDTKAALIGRANAAMRAEIADGSLAERLARKELEKQQEETRKVFLKEMDSGVLTNKKILNSNLDSSDQAQYIRMLKVSSEEKVQKTNGPLFISLFDRIHLPDGDPKKIYDDKTLNQYFGRGLTSNDIKTLRDEIQGQNTVEGQNEDLMKKALFDVARGKLTKTNPMLGLRDPEGDQDYAVWLSNFMTSFRQQREKGISAQSLLTPGSKEYLGQTIRAKPLKEVIESINRSNGLVPSTTTTTVPQLNPDESPEEYLKRTGQ